MEGSTYQESNKEQRGCAARMESHIEEAVVGQHGGQLWGGMMDRGGVDVKTKRRE